MAYRVLLPPADGEHVVRTEPNQRRVRVFFGGEPVADSSLERWVVPARGPRRMSEMRLSGADRNDSEAASVLLWRHRCGFRVVGVPLPRPACGLPPPAGGNRPR